MRFASGEDSVVVYRRDVAGRTLTFQRSQAGVITDKETGSTWDPLRGQATAGVLSGTSLTQVTATDAFWFGWFDFYPGTELYK